jgi:hypothetical protein
VAVGIHIIPPLGDPIFPLLASSYHPKRNDPNPRYEKIKNNDYNVL